MINREVNTSKLKGFRRKKIWPTIVLFIFLSFVCFALSSAILSVFNLYVVESKVENICEEASHIEKMLESRKNEKEKYEMLKTLEGYLKPGEDICVINKQGDVVFKLKDYEFGLDKYTAYQTQTERMVYGVENPELFLDEDKAEISVSAMDLIKVMLNYEDSEKWLENNMYEIGCWMEIDEEYTETRTFFRSVISMQRSDILFIGILMVLIVIVMSLPVILLCINVFSTISLQRRTVKILHTDVITEGKSWNYFLQKSSIELGKWSNRKNDYMMVNLHVDHYQDYCACCGTDNGEKFLKCLNNYLQTKVEKNETFARFENADFALLLKYTEEEKLEKRIKKMLAEITGIPCEQKITCRVGLHNIPANSGERHRERGRLDIEQLYNYAVSARTHNKDEINKIAVFDESIKNEYKWKHYVEETMETALQKEEFKVYLQPKLDPSTGKIVGAEALSRWETPEGIISPSKYIPILEKNGFITQLDDYMIASVAKLQSNWKIQGKKVFPISVNMSRTYFLKDNLAQHISDLVDSYGAQHELIELEAAESAFLVETNRLHKVLNEIKTYGFRIAMDDFGSGYSSLNSLKELPFDVLKIDMNMFKGTKNEERGKIIVRETIHMAKNLNMKIVAEGVEDREQVTFLADNGCDMIQGFYYSEPIPIEKFEEMTLKND